MLRLARGAQLVKLACKCERYRNSHVGRRQNKSKVGPLGAPTRSQALLRPGQEVNDAWEGSAVGRYDRRKDRAHLLPLVVKSGGSLLDKVMSLSDKSETFP